MPRRAEKTKGKPNAGKRYPLNMRTTFELRRQLEGAASASGRSLAQEAELRIEHSFRDRRLLQEALELAYGREGADILANIGEIMKAAGQHSGFLATSTLEGSQRWWDNPYAYDQAMRGVVLALKAFRPKGEVVVPPRAAKFKGGPPELNLEHLYDRIGEGLAGQRLRQFASEAPAALAARIKSNLGDAQ